MEEYRGIWTMIGHGDRMTDDHLIGPNPFPVSFSVGFSLLPRLKVVR
jgi:hypothetical protein